MKKIFLGGILSGLMAAMPLMGTSAISNTILLSNIAANGTSDQVGAGKLGFVLDTSRMINGAVQICSTDAPGATVVSVEIRLNSTFNWYIAGQLNGTTTVVPLCSSTSNVGYFTMPLGGQLRVEVSNYVSGHIFASYGERAF